MKRAEMQKRAQNEQFDVLVIGGGSAGAGVLLEAQTRGLKAALVEKYDFSTETSSRSTKLVHGGVRYLEAAIKRLDRVQWNLVRDALKERATLLRIAPHLAWKIELLTPLYTWWEVPYYLTGLKLYEALAGRARLGRAYFIPAAEAARRFPQIKKQGLKGAVVYADGQFDDARMNLAVVFTALAHGAVALNHTEAVALIKERGRVAGAEVRDRLSGDTYAIRARVVVNATGPFTDRIRRMEDPEAEPILETSSGVHLVLPPDYAPREMGLLIPKTEDGRVLFVLPWRGYTLAGTTDEPAEVSEHPVPTKKEIDYILRHLNKHFDLRPDEGEVRSAWSGLRPLVRDPRAADTAQLARDHVIVDGRYGLVTLTGGKWTTFRKMAEDLVDHLEKAHGLKPTKSVSAHTPLYGAEGFTPGGLKELEAVLPTDVARHLHQTYGDRAKAVAELAEQEGLTARLAKGHPEIEAEVVWAARHELAECPLDVLERRTRLAFLDVAAALSALPRVTALLARELGWSETETRRRQTQAEAWLNLAP